MRLGVCVFYWNSIKWKNDLFATKQTRKTRPINVGTCTSADRRLDRLHTEDIRAKSLGRTHDTSAGCSDFKTIMWLLCIQIRTSKTDLCISGATGAAQKICVDGNLFVSHFRILFFFCWTNFANKNWPWKPYKHWHRLQCARLHSATYHKYSVHFILDFIDIGTSSVWMPTDEFINGSNNISHFVSRNKSITINIV